MAAEKSHVFFDFDGVLCDSLGACIEEFNALREARFPTLPFLNQAARMDVAFSGPLKTALLQWLSADLSRSFFDAHSASMRERASELRPFPGVRSLLSSLPYHSASVVSSAYNSAIKTVICDEHGRLPPSISNLMGRDIGKDKTEKIRDVLSGENLSAASAVYVGDLHSDLLYCDHVPLDCILVTYGYHTTAHLHSVAPTAFALVDSVEQLGELLMDLLEAR